MEIEQITEAVRKAKSGSKKRNFIQSVDLAISLRDVNLKDPSKRFRADVLVPSGLGKPITICVIGDAAIISKAKEAGIEHTLDENAIDQLSRDPKEAKSFIESVDYFLAIPQMMANVGKQLGRHLGPAGKMPTVLPPNAPIDQFTTRLNRTISIRLRQNPIIHCRVGTESMEDGEIAANIRTVLNEIEGRMDQGPNNINKAHIKLSMGPAIQIGN